MGCETKNKSFNYSLIGKKIILTIEILGEPRQNANDWILLFPHLYNHLTWEGSTAKTTYERDMKSNLNSKIFLNSISLTAET